MKKTKLFIKKHAIGIWIVIASIILSSSLITYAFYTRDNKAKRVVATLTGSGNQFSSNYLTESTEDKFKFAYFGAGSNSLPVYVTVCNYPQGSNRPFEMDIPYSIAISLIDKNGNPVDTSAWAVTPSEDPETPTPPEREIIVYRKAEGSTEYKELIRYNSSSAGASYSNDTYVLERGGASTDTYWIQFNNFDIEDALYEPVYVDMTAAPIGLEGSSINTLYGAISVKLRGAEADVSWDGDFNDDRSKQAALYDDFNYLITGTGTGTFAFAWNPNAIEVNKIFYDEVTGIATTTYGTNLSTDVVDNTGKTILTYDAEANAGYSYFIISVNSETRDRYSFQLYKKETPSSGTSYSTWNELNGYVYKEFH